MNPEHKEEWLSENIWQLREDFLQNDEMFRENFPHYTEHNTDREEYIELQGLEDEFNEFCNEIYKEACAEDDLRNEISRMRQ